ncbi:MAG: hypothetical protein WBB19_17195 [Desulforhopalus sp.]
MENREQRLLPVTAKLHPFDEKCVVELASEGQSIASVIDFVAGKNEINAWYLKDVYVELNGTPIVATDFAHTFVKRTDNLIIQFRIPKGKEGKNPLRTILMIVVTIVAIAAQQHWFLGTAWSGYGAAAIMLVGGMAVNALVPIKPLSDTGLGHDSTGESDIYNISGMRNYVPRYKPLPLVLGKVKFAPPYGALPYTRIQGNDQYLHFDVVWGHGPLAIGPLSLGDTLLSNYSDVRTATNYGYPTDQELNLYPYDVDETSVGSGSGTVVSAGVPVIRTTVAGTNKATLDFVFSSGLFGINSSTGNRQQATVQLSVYKKLSTDPTWLWVETKIVTDLAAYPKRFSMEVDFGDFPDQYDIKVERDSPETGDTIYDELTWSIIRSIIMQDPVTFDIPIAETQGEIKATDQLGGVIDDLNAECQSICLDYDLATDTWIERATSNNASLVRLVLQGPATAKPLPDEDIDIAALEEWHEFCTLSNYEYNKVHDTHMSTDDICFDICFAGRSSFVRIGNLRTVVIDRARPFGAKQSFNSDNASNFSSKKTFLDDIHGYRVLFNNAALDSAEDEVIVYAEGYSQANATLLEAKELPGVVHVDQVIDLTKYHLGVRKHRSEVFTWKTDWEHIICNRGDLVALAHPCIQVGLAQGRIRSVDYPTKTIVLDQQFSIEAQTDYGISIRTTPTSVESSEIFVLPVFAADWTTDTFTWVGDIPQTITKGDIYSAGELGKETISVIMTSKTPHEDGSATCTAVMYAWDEIQAYMNGEYQVVHTGISTPVFTSSETPPPPTITHVTTGVSSAVTNSDGSTTNRITLIISIPSGYSVVVSSIQVEILTADGWDRSSSTDPSNPVVFNNVAPGDHQIRARSVAASGRVSAWVFKTVTQVSGTPSPSAILSLTVQGNLFQNDLRWVLPPDFRPNYRIAIYCSPGVNDRSNTGDPVAILSGGTIWSHTGLNQSVEYYYWARVIGPVGEVSGPPAETEEAWTDETGDEWVDESGEAWTSITTASPMYSEWYPLSATGGIAASPITDNARILDMLTESIGKGQLSEELNTVIEGATEGIVYQQQFFENSWTVKIQEINGVPYMVGLGAVIYPDWQPDTFYTAGTYVWLPSDSNVYKAKVDHLSSAANIPPLDNWELIPFGKKSAVAIIADQFSVSLPDGTGTRTPFVISGDAIGFDGTVIVKGSVHADALAADDIYALRIQSSDYQPLETGYKFDAVTGTAEFNGSSFLLNMTIDTESGGFRVRDAVTTNYVEILAGDIKFYQMLGGEYRAVKSLKNIDAGTCTNGVWKVLPGYWAKSPTVMVAPNHIKLFDAGYGDQSQELDCPFPVVEALGGGQYRFYPTVKTVIAGGSVGTVINVTGSPSAQFNLPVVNVGAMSLACSFYAIYKLEWVTDNDGQLSEHVFTGWVSARIFYDVLDNYGWRTRVYLPWVNREGYFTQAISLTGYTNIQTVRVGLELNTNSHEIYPYYYLHPHSPETFTNYTTIVSYNASMTGMQQISSGTLNYIAIA